MKAFLFNSVLAFVVLNVAPGYDACGNKIKDFPDEAVDSIDVADSVEFVTDSILLTTDSLDV